MSPRQSTFGKDKAQVILPNGMKVTIECPPDAKINLLTPLGITEALRLAYHRTLVENEWIFPGVYARQWAARKLGELIKKYVSQVLETDTKEQMIFLIFLRFYHLTLDVSEKIELNPVSQSEMETAALAIREFVRTRSEKNQRFDTLGLWAETTLMLFGVLTNQEANTSAAAVESIIKRLKSVVAVTLERPPSVISSKVTPLNLEQLFEKQQKDETEKLDNIDKTASKLAASFIKLAQDRLEAKEKIIQKKASGRK